MIAPVFTPFPVLETERLVLREMVKNDAPVYYKMRTDDIVMRYLDKDKCASLEVAESFTEKLIEERKANDNINWAICNRETDEMIGNICFCRLEKEHHRAEIGYNLLPDSHGKGIASEAMKSVLDFGFNTMNLHSVEAQVNPHNVNSIKLLKKHHFIKEGHFKENYCWNGKFLDTVVFSLLKSNYESHLIT